MHHSYIMRTVLQVKPNGLCRRSRCYAALARSQLRTREAALNALVHRETYHSYEALLMRE